VNAVARQPFDADLVAMNPQDVPRIHRTFPVQESLRSGCSASSLRFHPARQNSLSDLVRLGRFAQDALRALQVAERPFG
jgi:hypothetical protein